MSKQPTKIAAKTTATKTATTATPAKPKPRASFAAASFGNLRAAAGEGQGEALRILLADIDEDPDQPRKTFDKAELESMAESIRLNGVVQPIVVRPPEAGRYMLAFGARRYRASKLAGVRDIPAVVRAKSDDDFSAQIIENQHRKDLNNGELADATERLASEGKTNKQIGVICSLKDYQVAAFRQVRNFPPELRQRLDSADIRALYDLFRQWGKTPARVIDALPDAETFITITEARRIIGGITGKPTGSIVLDRQAAAQATPPAEVAAPAPRAAAPAQAPAQPSASPAPAPRPAAERPAAAPISFERPAPASAAETTPANGGGIEQQARATMAAELAKVDAKPQSAPVFIVQGKDAETGQLVVDRRAEREGWALVRFPSGEEEIALSELRIVRIE